MLSGFDSSLDSRLREAEEAEKELLRLTPVAEEAPKLRLEKAKVQKRQERDQTKNSAMRVVERSMQSATDKQTRVPELLLHTSTTPKGPLDHASSAYVALCTLSLEPSSSTIPDLNALSTNCNRTQAPSANSSNSSCPFFFST